MFSQEIIRLQHQEFSEEFSQIELRYSEVESEVLETEREIEYLKERIGDLFEEKRHANKEEKPYFQDQIQSLLSDKSLAYEKKNSLRSQLKEVKEHRRQVHIKGKSLANKLRREVLNHQSNAEKLSRANTSSSSAGLNDIKAIVKGTHEFARSILHLIQEKIGGSTEDEEITFEPIIGATTATQLGDLTLAEPIINDIYLTNDESRTIPLIAYTVTDSLEPLADNLFDLIEKGIFSGTDAAIQIGKVAVEYASALLGAAGHQAILDLGGPGEPDILSLDEKGTFWITEVKGTATIADLPNSGLRRKLKDPGGEIHLMENSAQWIARKFTKTLASVEYILANERDVTRRTELAKLKDAFVASARNNFSRDSYKTQIVQVGFSSDNDLKPPYAQKSKSLDNWIEQTNPERIIQIDVVPSHSVAGANNAKPS